MAVAHVKQAQTAPEFIATTTPVSPPVAAPVVTVAAVPLRAAVATPPLTNALPRVASYDLPLQDLAQVAQGSGLQWVNSDAGKIAEAQVAIAAEAKPAHVPRQRPPVAVVTAAPLVLVETKRDLGTMPLPFEKPAG